jgi:ATP-binding cassette subfamily G (WHITE) protein 2 (SNQ2)
MIGALRWITYVNVRRDPFFNFEFLSTESGHQPIRYGFEAVLTNEFHTLNGACSDLVPRGAGYENITLVNQVCTTIGSLPEQPFVNGDSFVELSYGYSHSHLWRVSRTCCFLRWNS